MWRPSTYQRISLNGQRGLRTTLSNINEATRNPETLQLVSVDTPSGDLLYAIGVAPTNVFDSYRGVFNRVVDSIALLK